MRKNFGFFLIGVEILTIIFPHIWGWHYYEIRFWIDVLYYMWILSYFPVSPAWTISFIIWPFVPEFAGLYEGVRYLNAPEWFLRLDSVVCMGFIAYALIFFEANGIFIDRLVKNGILPPKIAVWCIIQQTKYTQRAIRKMFQRMGKTNIAHLLYLLHAVSEAFPDYTVIFLENQEYVSLDVNFRQKLIVFSSPNRIAQIARQCLRYNREDAWIFILNHAEI